jgi:hypothetical protein
MPAAIDTAPAGDAERRLLEALVQRYAGDPFSARDAAAAIPSTLWEGVGIPRPDAGSVGRWLRAHRNAALTGKPDRSGVVRWRLRGATGPVAALQAPVPATRTPASPLAQQAPVGGLQRDPAPPAQQAPVGGPQPVHAPQQPAQQPLPPPAQQAPVGDPQQPWWHPPAPAADIGLPGPRWGCTAWWAPDGGSAS